LAAAEWREPASSDRLPSIGGVSPAILGGCSPAEPLPLHQLLTIASPVTDNSSFNPDSVRQSNALLNLTEGSSPARYMLGWATSGAIPDLVRLAQRLAVMQCRVTGRVRATGVSSLLCAPGVISILRRHVCAPFSVAPHQGVGASLIRTAAASGQVPHQMVPAIRIAPPHS